MCSYVVLESKRCEKACCSKNRKQFLSSRAPYAPPSSQSLFYCPRTTSHNLKSYDPALNTNHKHSENFTRIPPLQ